jgi:uncharacterized protein
MHILAATIVFVFGVIGVVLTVLTLPGTWLAVIVAALCTWWQPQLMSWWVIGAAAALALLAEIVEFGASAVGTAKAGGTRRGGVGSLVGGLAGAIFGAPFFFGLGAIPGAVIGAGVGAVVAERGWAKRTWTESTKAGKGAAIGRLVATVLKVAFAAAIALLLTIGVIVGFFTPAQPTATPTPPAPLVVPGEPIAPPAPAAQPEADVILIEPSPKADPSPEPSSPEPRPEPAEPTAPAQEPPTPTPGTAP